MHRSPPTHVLRELRREVGFGCPLPECRKAILTWHHFDPPWREEHHHRPEGMIALCTQHAAAADRGLYSNAMLRELKGSAGAADEVRATLPWAARNFLIRLGGCYSGGESVPLLVAGRPVLSVSRDANGLLLLSIELRAKDGTFLARIEDNFFEADPTWLQDVVLDTAPTHVKIWLAERTVGLELSFRRVTLEELGEVLALDKTRADRDLDQNRQELLPPEVQEWLSRDASSSNEWMRSILGDSIPVWMQDAVLSGDLTGGAVREYAKNEFDDEGKLAFLDVRKLHVHSNGRELVVRDGLGSSIIYSASFNNGRGGFSL